MSEFEQIVSYSFTPKETEMIEASVYSDPATWEGTRFKSLQRSLYQEAIREKMNAAGNDL